MKNCGPGKHKGNPCKVCGARGRGRPPGKKSAAKPAAAPRKKLQAGEAVSARLAGTLGVAALSSAPLGAGEAAVLFGGEPAAPPPPPSTFVPAAPDTPEPLPPEGPTWCKSAGRRLAALFVASTEWAMEKAAKRRANDPDDDDVDAFGEAMGQQLGMWFPDSELSPAKQLMISGSFIVGAMWIGAEKIPPKKETIIDEAKQPDAPNGAHAAGTTSNVIPLHD